jgi:hypothetical protein
MIVWSSRGSEPARWPTIRHRRTRIAVAGHRDRARAGSPPRVAFEDIVEHPRLPAARKVYVDRFLEVYGGDRFWSAC